jgi:Domain of unknown function (DUF4760)
MEPPKLTDWIQAISGTGTAFIALAAAYYAYRTLDHMRRSSSEANLRESTVRTHRTCQSQCDKAMKYFQDLHNSLHGREYTEGDKAKIIAVLNAWEGIASALNSGILDPAVFYVYGKQPLLNEYRKLAWFVRQERFLDPYAYNELEKLIRHINDIECSTFAVTPHSLRRLKSLGAPPHIIEVVKRAVRLWLDECHPFHARLKRLVRPQASDVSRFLTRFKQLLMPPTATYSTWETFEEHLDSAANNVSPPIDLYRPVIFASTRCPGTLPIVHIDARNRAEQLQRHGLASFVSSERDMYRQILEYTGHRYPFDIGHPPDDEHLTAWCSKEIDSRLCQLVILDNNCSESNGTRKILAHMTLSRRDKDDRWERLFEQLSQLAKAKSCDLPDLQTGIIARDWYLNKYVKTVAKRREILRAILRRAIQLVEQGKLAHEPHERSWLLLGLVPPSRPYLHDRGVQRIIIEEEGGRYLGSAAVVTDNGPSNKKRKPKDRELSIDIFVFGPVFKLTPPAPVQSIHGGAPPGVAPPSAITPQPATGHQTGQPVLTGQPPLPSAQGASP